MFSGGHRIPVVTLAERTKKKKKKGKVTHTEVFSGGHRIPVVTLEERTKELKAVHSAQSTSQMHEKHNSWSRPCTVCHQEQSSLKHLSVSVEIYDLLAQQPIAAGRGGVG